MSLPERPDVELKRFVRASLVDRVQRDHRESDAAFKRRRIVVAITLVLGAAVLGFSLNLSPGNNLFYPATFLLAAIWIAGAFASGPLHLGYANTRKGSLTRPLVQPVVLGIAAISLFVLGALVVAQIPVLLKPIDAVLDHARFASLPVVAVITMVNGIAEEVFFRGALFAAIGVRYPVLISTVMYGVATLTTGNVMLVFAALVLGVITGMQRAVTGGVLAPMLTHVVWSLGMLFILPPLLKAVS